MLDASLPSGSIHIAFACDDNYVKPLLVAMTSVLSNTSSHVVVHILDDGISQRNRSQITRLAEHFEAHVDFLEIDHAWLLNFPADSRLAKTTYLRLKLPSCLPDVPRCIYLDADLFVRHDVAELWHFDLRGMAVAAVKDIVADFMEEGKRLLRIGDDHIYFNAGVLLMDLDQLREIRLEEQAIAFAAAHPERITVVDQDILNFLLQGRVAYFDLEWNYCLICLPDRNPDEPWHELQILYSEDERARCAKDAAIVHFANFVKPWHCTQEALQHPYFAEYFEYVALTLRSLARCTADNGNPSKPRVTVVVCGRRPDETITRCLASVVQQSLQDFELIVVNDSANEQIDQILQAFATWDSRILIVDNEHGLGAGMNAAIEVAQGEYVAFVASSDWIEPEMLRVLLRKADASRADIVCCDFFVAQDSRDRPYGRFRSLRHCQEYYSFSEVNRPAPDVPAFWAGLYRRQFLAEREIRFLELSEEGHIDTHFFWMSHLNASRIVLVDVPLYHHESDGPLWLGGETAQQWPSLVENYREIRRFLKEERLFSELRGVFFSAMYRAYTRVARDLPLESKKFAEVARSELSDIDDAVLSEGPFSPRDRHIIRSLQAGKPVGFLAGTRGSSWDSRLAKPSVGYSRFAIWRAKIACALNDAAGPELRYHLQRLEAFWPWKLAVGVWRTLVVETVTLIQTLLQVAVRLPGFAGRCTMILFRRLRARVVAARATASRTHAAPPLSDGGQRDPLNSGSAVAANAVDD